MFVSSANYLLEVEKLVSSCNFLNVAVAFWGAGSEDLIAAAGEKPIRIICCLNKGATNPSPIQKLLRRSNIQVRQLDNLHAKVIVGNSYAIVGSANFSTNGLNDEPDENDGWEEAGVLVDDQESRFAIESWFENLWTQAREISKEDISNAFAVWSKRRSNRHQIPTSNSLLDREAAFFKDRPAYIVFHRGRASEKAVSIGEAGRKQGANVGDLEKTK